MIHALALWLFAVPLFAQNGIAEQYNAIYSDDAEQATFSHAPNAFLVEFTKTLKPVGPWMSVWVRGGTPFTSRNRAGR